MVCRVFDSIEPEALRAEGEGEGKGGVWGFEFARGMREKVRGEYGALSSRAE